MPPPALPPGHPVDTFRRENQALHETIVKIRQAMSAASGSIQKGTMETFAGSTPRWRMRAASEKSGAGAGGADEAERARARAQREAAVCLAGGGLQFMMRYGARV